MNSTMKFDEYGNKYWEDERGYLHREDGPADEGKDGFKGWYFNNKNTE